MGKLKKPCKNAYFYFIMEEKEKYVNQGYRFNGGFNEASQMFGHLWSKLSKDEKWPYELLAKGAKENEKYNMNNKFTVTGETYAAIHQKRLDDEAARDRMIDFINQLVSGPEAGDRNFIFIKVVHSVEEIIDRKTKQFWPAELAMTAFSLKGGIKAIYTQLIDTLKTPTGYASQAKEVSEETMLPMPGDTKLFARADSDYVAILKKINGFANHYLKDGYNVSGHKKVFFALEGESDQTISSIQWMVNQLPKGEPHGKYQYFIDNLKVYRLSKLVLALANEANRVNPDYKSYLVNGLDASADAVVTKGNYDYREEIACSYHRRDFASVKMHNCAQSYSMRRAFMLFEEFLPAFKYVKRDRHDIGKLNPVRGPVVKRPRRSPSPDVLPAAPTEYRKIDAVPDWLKHDDDEVETFDYSASNALGASATCSWNPLPTTATTLRSEEFPSLAAETAPPPPSDPFPSSWGAPKKQSPVVSPSPQSTTDYPAWSTGSRPRGAGRGYDPHRQSRPMESDSQPPSHYGHRQSRPMESHSPPSHHRQSRPHSPPGHYRQQRPMESRSHAPAQSQVPAGYAAWAASVAPSSGTARGYEAPVQRTFLDDQDSEFPSLSSAGRGRGRRH